jgi:hypothetical protein
MGGLDGRSVNRRLQDLERLIGTPEDEEAELRRAAWRDILDEFAALQSCRARNSYRGGNPPTPIQPTDPAGDTLGYPYTTGQLTEFAVRRVFERAREEDPDSFTHESTKDLIETWTENMRREAFGECWEEIEAERPPEPTPPWH